MNIKSLGLRACIALGLALSLLLAVPGAANSLPCNIAVKYEAAGGLELPGGFR